MNHNIKELLSLGKDNMQFTVDLQNAVQSTDVGFITVGTPAKADGSTDLSYITSAAQAIGKAVNEGQQYLIINKSTVPIGTGHYVKVMAEQGYQFQHGTQPKLEQISVASNPEFLREGSAVFDSLYPNRIVVGTEEYWALELLETIYEPLIYQKFPAPSFAPRPKGLEKIPFIETNRTSSETIKYAANTFLALKISFINQVAGLCELVGADVTEVAHGIGLDERIGSRFLRAGIGWGGSCFGKDTQSLISTAGEFGYDMSILKAVLASNKNQHFTVVEKLQKELKVLKGKRISLLGLSFKPDTDDVRDAPSIAIIKELLKRGAMVSAHDPVSIKAFKQMHPELHINYEEDLAKLFTASEAVVLITEWSAYRKLDWANLIQTMANKLIIDGRNFLDKSLIVTSGAKYIGVGVTEEV